LYFDKKGDEVSVGNKFSATIGVNRWSFSVKPEIVAINNTIDGSFESAFSDLKFSILNAFYVNGKNSLAASVEFNIPFGNIGFGSQYFSVTPAITYSRTISSSLFLAIQPQYTFSLAKNTQYPNLRVLTNRIFLAKFTSSGYFYVFEPRTIIDFENKKFDLILSPIIGKSIGAGFNLIGLMEIPTKKSTSESRGVLFQVGFNKNF
jgi:hypothetical protein